VIHEEKTSKEECGKTYLPSQQKEKWFKLGQACYRGNMNFAVVADLI
jgi:hypothetical protein